MTGTSTRDPETNSPRPKRRGWLLASIAIVVIVAVGAGVAYLLLGGDGDDPDPHEANAGRVAEAMLADFTPPDGTTPVSETPALDRLIDPDAPVLDQQVERTKRWRLTGDAMTVTKEIAAEPPAGYEVLSNTPMKTGSGIIYVWLRTEDATTPALHEQGIRSRGLELSLLDAADDTVELLATATVNWAGTRAADTKIPTNVTGLDIAHAPDGAAPPITEWDRPATITDRGEIDRVVTMINSLDPGPESTATLDCVRDPETTSGSYRLSLNSPDDVDAASAVVDTAGCPIVRLTIDGHDKGNFWGTAELSTALHELHGDHS